MLGNDPVEGYPP
jgi:hypothetical protein